jgi:hypothetical protein
MVNVHEIRWDCTHGAAGWVILGVFDVIGLDLCGFRVERSEECLGKGYFCHLCGLNGRLREEDGRGLDLETTDGVGCSGTGFWSVRRH